MQHNVSRAWIAICALAVWSGCAAEPGGSIVPDATTLELVSATPDVAAPLWVRTPIVLNFSAHVDAASVRAGVRLESSGAPVEYAERVDGPVVMLYIPTAPSAPTTLTLSVTAELRDQMGRAALPATRSWQLPLWHTSPAQGASARAPRLAHGFSRTWLAWETDAAIQVAQQTPEGLRNVEVLPLEAGAHLSDLAVDGEDRPIVVWHGALGHVARYEASGWQALDLGLDLALPPSMAPRVASDGQDTLWLAWPTSTGIELLSWSLTGPWQRTAPLVAATAAAVDVAWSPSGAVVAALVDNAGQRDLLVQRFEAGAWRVLAEALDHNRANDVAELAVESGENGAPVVAWTEGNDGTSHLYVARFSERTAEFHGLGPALNVDPERSATGITLGPSGGLAPLVVGFQEDSASYVARHNGSAFEVLGGSLGGRAGPAVGLNHFEQPIAAVARADNGAIELLQFNESPLPYGLSERKPQPCTLPPDSDPAFPKLLSHTGCYAELAAQQEAAGWIPYDLNSPLWSDGAYKRRFFSIPDNTTMGFTQTDAWEVPVGTMLAKEFWLQREPGDPTTRFIVETRLMIKRCEPGSCRASWQGYSYQWNATGDEATLLENNSETVVVEWPVAGGMHKHSYPGRDECTRCHALSAGGALGLRTQQLNRNYRYGEVVDHQLRALFHAGLFSETQPPVAMTRLQRLPTPSDSAYDLNARVRGYFDANCSHCHSPTSRWPVVDLRFDAQLRADDGSGMTGNICNMLVPGNAEASILYVKLKAVPGAVPEGFPGDTMPPIARLLPDEAQLPRIKAWIDGMTACP
jgi:hypothetical protein